MSYPIPDCWTISGTLNISGVPFFEGKIYADNLINGEFQQIAESGISSDGSFTLVYSRANFQNGDDSLEYPTIRLRVEDYQQNNLWTSNIYNEPSSALNVGSIDISKHPDQNGDCRIFGTVKNEQGNILEGIKVVAYCLHFVDTSDTTANPSGYFEKIVLGETVSDSSGNYVRRYSSTLLPVGLLLDSKEDYGKNKVSLYAEAYEKKGNVFYLKATEHLVFNGKTEQEINFVLRTKQETFECEYERLHSALEIYRNAVVAWSDDPTDNTKKIKAINSFLKSNTTFPLVVGRERIIDSKVYAYFTAYSMLLQLQNYLHDDNDEAIYLSEEPPKKWEEVFFALALRENVTSLKKLTKVKPTIIQKTLFGAESDGLICAVDSSHILNLWKKLVVGGALQNSVDEENEDSLTISQLLSLYIKKNLTIQYPQENGTPDETQPQILPHYVAIEEFDDSPEIENNEQSRYNELLDAYYSAGADIDSFLELLQKNILTENVEIEGAEGDEPDIDSETLIPQRINVPHLSQIEFSRLKTIFDLNDFFEKFAPGVVCAYRYATHKEDFEFDKLSDLIRLNDADWTDIVDKIAEEYFILYCSESEIISDDEEDVEEYSVEDSLPEQEDTPEDDLTGDEPSESSDEDLPYALPANFPGNNASVKKVIYTRKLSELITKWFPQHALLWNLEENLDGQEWNDTCELLMSARWDDFSLSDMDLNVFIGKDASLLDLDSSNSSSSGEDEETENLILSAEQLDTKNRILQLQRLYHLTECAEAIAYLISHDFKSAYQISSISENDFVARHGNGLGKVSEARRIHRLAQNYMAEASLNIQAYVTSTVEEPVDEDFSDEDDEFLVPQNEQNGQEIQNETLRALPRALPKARILKASKSTASTNTARIREATRDTINWAGLFGNVNFTRATQGQSILSASAYYIDLLKFLKKSSAYSMFVGRRPDYLDLQLTKANAEIPMPTIDLGIELLECLVDEDLDRGRKARLVANNNPDGVTAAELRAEPLEFKTKIGASIDTTACNLLATKIYPFQLPANFSRDKAKKILSNLSLHFYDIAEALELNGNDAYACRELRLDFNQRCLVDLLSTDAEKQDALAQFNSLYNTWDLWGLKERANSVLYPDKNYTSAGTYIGILRRVAIFMQRTGFTIQDLNEILANKNFSDVCYRSKDPELYQLSNINGYEFAGKTTVVNKKEVEIPVDWDSFFRKMAVLVHRKNILGWSLSDVLLTFNLPLEKLDVICELIGRYGISVQDALVLGGEQEPSADFINSIYQLPNLLVSVNKGQDGYRRTVLKLLTQGLKLSEEDSIRVYSMIDVDENASLLEGLFECYRYTLIAKTFGVSLPNLDKIVKYGVWANSDRHSLEGIRKFSDEWRFLSGTSIGAEFYLDLLAPISEDEKQAARDFAANIVVADLGDRNVPEGQWENNLNLLVGAEFGIAEEDFETLIKLNEAWIPFYNAFSTYYSNFHIWEDAFKNDKNTEIQEPEYPEEQISVYVDFARKIRVFNYIQTTHQGVNLDDNLFVQIDLNSSISPLNNMWKLIYANYTTDRLLSGEFNLDLLSSLMQNENEGDWEKLEDLLVIDGDTIERLRDASFGMTATAYADTLGWIKFVKAYELYAKTHCVLSDLEQLLYEDNIGFNANVVRFEQTIKNNTKESEWLKFAQEMNDDLRKRKRDALAAYVCWDSCFVPTNDSEPNSEYVSRYPQQFVDESDIYAYYLMDVKMEPDMTISRIVQATASIQLFVQRAELGLEGQNVLTDEQRGEWEWMKNYRVWEAARKVFLYPENWIASDLRDDKTPFFEELEDRIQEFSDDHASLENALYEYLEKVREVSSIEIVGATKEDGGDEGGILYTLHIVGRTQGEPHTYYYRKYKAKAILSGEWTPWERLDVDIPSETVAPAVVNQRLYLLWPQVTLGQRNIESTSEGGLETIEYYARIQICWTSYTGTKWTGTRMTKNALFDSSTNQLDFALEDNENIGDRYHLKTISSLDGVAVSVIKTSYHYHEYEEIVGTTEVMDGSVKINKATKRIYDKTRQYFKRIAISTIKADGSDSLEIVTADERPVDDFAPERTKLIHGVFTETEYFTCGNKKFCYPENNAILNYTPGGFRIVATNLSMLKLGNDDKVEDLPFFYMDGRRTFFVQAVPKDGNVNSSQKNYKFELISHSLVDDFYKRYRDGGTKWLYTRETQALPISDSYYYSYSYYNYYFSVYLGYYMAGDWQAWDLGQTIFRYNYWPNKASVDGPYPAPMVDFVWGGANAIYNWELFFYVPMLIAEKMIAEQSYEEALLWLQLVFDPRENYSNYERTKHFIHKLPKGARYWKFLPFFANKDADKSVLQMLGLPTNQDKLPDRSALQSLVDKWKNDPFNPHLIARYRNVAYQKYVIMKYLDTLIGWGDQEFSKDTTESVNLAIQFYILAAELLGPKNPEAPEPNVDSPLSASALLSNTDALGNAFIEYENCALIGKSKAKSLSIRAMDARTRRTGNIVESMFYFSVPRNETLFAYWDTIADRLYKIRNSLNIQGVKRTLALFAPPIDPGMLVKARAMGISIDSILNSTNEKMSIYRFRVIVKLAVDMAKDACQMGRDLLAILEKQDAEQLQVFKAKCDKAVVAESKAVQEMEVKSLEAEKVRLEEKKAAKQNTSKMQKAMHLMSAAEKKYQKLMEKVAKIQETVEKVRNIASATFKIPDFKYGSVVNAFGGPRFDIESLGGTKLAENLVSAAESYAARFAQRQLDAAKTKLQAELERRKKEWLLEDEVADAEVVEVEKQEIINEIKTQQVEKKHKNIENEILRSEQVYEVLSEKFTNNELYVWLEKELGKTFKKYVNLLIEVAKMAERAYLFEIEGKKEPDYNFIKPSYWDGFRKGLLAPEKILLDLRQMEKAYLENDCHRTIISRPVLLTDDMKTSGETDPFVEYQILDLGSLVSESFVNNKNRKITDVFVQVFSDSGIPPYVCINAEIVLTSSLGSGTCWSSSMAQTREDQIDIHFACDKYLPFEGISLDNSQWTIKVSGQIPSDAKIVMFIKYIAQSAV